MRQLFLCSILLILPLFHSCEKKGEEVHTHAESSAYICPMHPEVRKGEPGNCPICGMPLVKEKTDTKEKGHLLPSEYQKRVLNYTTTMAEKEEVTFRLPVSGRVTGKDEVSFSVYESDLRFISSGQSFVGKLSGSSQERRGSIVTVDHIADPSSHTVRVVGRVQTGDKLHPIEGSFFGEILSPKTKALLISEEAILHSGKKTLVYLHSDEGVLTPTEIETGRRIGERVEVLSGLKDGDVIAEGPNFLLDSEARLKGIHD